MAEGRERGRSRATERAERTAAAGEGAGPPIELGWILYGSLEPPDVDAVRGARDGVLEELRERFPRFDWRMPLIELPEGQPGNRIEPVELLEQALAERHLRHWDFALLVTGVDLVGHHHPWAVAVPSSSLAVAVISTYRIDPRAADAEAAPRQRAEVMSGRIRALALHLFGDLNDVDHREEPEDFMRHPPEIADLDRMQRFAPEDLEQLGRELDFVADLRLEEREGAERRGRARFYLHAAWTCRRDIASAVLQAKPWQFPFHFSRLTAAAFSTLLVLLVTAEAWELGTSRPPSFLVLFSLFALAATSAWIVKRQHLFIGRGVHRLTEQVAVANLSVAAVVVLGMLTTYLLLFGATFLVSQTVFSSRVIAGWAQAIEGPVGLGHYLRESGFVAALGVVIGALGASFEGKTYFRHIAYVDEEI